MVKTLILPWANMDAYGGIQTLVRAQMDSGTGAELACEPLSRGAFERLAHREQVQSFCRDVAEAVRIGGLDLVHSHNLHIEMRWGLAVLLDECLREHGVPHVMTVHDVGSDPGCWRMLGCLSSTRLITQSEYNRRRLRDLLGIDPPVIAPGIRFEEFQRVSQNKEWGAKTVACPGRITPRKGLRHALGLLAELAERIGPLTLALSDRTRNASGQTDEFLLSLEEQARRSGLVQLRFGRQESHAAETYRGAACTLLVPERPEGFGLAALESLACGRPVVFERFGALADWLPELPGAYPCDKGDRAGLLSALESILFDPQNAIDACLGASAAIQQGYSSNRMVRDLQMCYRQLIHRVTA